MNPQIPPLNCPQCGYLIQRDIEEIKEHEIWCPKCQESFRAYPKVEWEFWQKFKEEKIKVNEV